jgi:lipid-A-disaccharide synthase
MLAASVLQAIRESSDLAGLKTRGIGGPKMMATGFEALWPMETLAVRGYVEAIQQLPAILSVRNALIKELTLHPPKAFLGIDAPDFNLGVEKKLKGAGIPTIHFILLRLPFMKRPASRRPMSVILWHPVFRWRLIQQALKQN